MSNRDTHISLVHCARAYMIHNTTRRRLSANMFTSRTNFSISHFNLSQLIKTVAVVLYILQFSEILCCVHRTNLVHPPLRPTNIAQPHQPPNFSYTNGNFNIVPSLVYFMRSTYFSSSRVVALHHSERATYGMGRTG